MSDKRSPQEVAEALAALVDLHAKGMLTDDQFESAKSGAVSSQAGHAKPAVPKLPSPARQVAPLTPESRPLPPVNQAADDDVDDLYPGRQLPEGGLAMIALILGGAGLAIFAILSGDGDQESSTGFRIPTPQERMAATCVALDAAVSEGQLNDEARGLAAAHPLVIRLIDGGLTPSDLATDESTIPCAGVASNIWPAFVDAMATTPDIWAGPTLPSSDLVSALLAGKGLPPETRSVLSERTDRESASASRLTTSAELGAVVELCSVTSTLVGAAKRPGCDSAIKRHASMVKAEEAAAAKVAAAAAAAEAKARKAIIDEALSCNTDCLKTRVGFDLEAERVECAQTCSRSHGLGRSDWETAFVDRCSPPPSSDRAAATCVVILSIQGVL